MIIVVVIIFYIDVAESLFSQTIIRIKTSFTNTINLTAVCLNASRQDAVTYENKGAMDTGQRGSERGSRDAVNKLLLVIQCLPASLLST